MVASHPTWVRGLKFGVIPSAVDLVLVAPHVGAWIEMHPTASARSQPDVAPHVGAWIEIKG